ncbi:hypothetical protein [Aquabacterium sp. NJ1]|uniref:hypothetical protein n=1 Tax=Aquabacterium sp. NJ1 TaxID=1538295 RepID=UPI001269FFD5|nr:hypothetical protein [Aquabacterium sp. NJ1]
MINNAALNAMLQHYITFACESNAQLAYAATYVVATVTIMFLRHMMDGHHHPADRTPFSDNTFWTYLRRHRHTLYRLGAAVVILYASHEIARVNFDLAYRVFVVMHAHGAGRHSKPFSSRRHACLSVLLPQIFAVLYGPMQVHSHLSQMTWVVDFLNDLCLTLLSIQDRIDPRVPHSLFRSSKGIPKNCKQRK